MEYQTLRRIALGFRILGFVTLAVTALTILNVLSGGTFGILRVAGGLGFLAALDAIVKAAGSALAFFAASELIPLAISIAENTRRAAGRTSSDDYSS